MRFSSPPWPSLWPNPQGQPSVSSHIEKTAAKLGGTKQPFGDLFWRIASSQASAKRPAESNKKFMTPPLTPITETCQTPSSDPFLPNGSAAGGICRTRTQAGLVFLRFGGNHAPHSVDGKPYPIRSDAPAVWNRGPRIFSERTAADESLPTPLCTQISTESSGPPSGRVRVGLPIPFHVLWRLPRSAHQSPAGLWTRCRVFLHRCPAWLGRPLPDSEGNVSSVKPGHAFVIV